MARNRKPHANADSIRRRKQTQRRQRQDEEASVPKPDAKGEVRLNRFIAQAGLCSRRAADELIAGGKVTVNGERVTEMGLRVKPAQDRVEVDGQPIRPQSLYYVLLNKPKDAITTTEDDRGRRTVMDLLDDEAREKGVVPVGRLDRDTTGVLLLTNDGDLAYRLMHPRYEIEKFYVVETDQPVSRADLERLTKGIELEDGPARADQVDYVEGPTRIGLALHEGRNRQIRRMFEAMDYRVEKLERVRYAGLTAEGVRRNDWRTLEHHEINTLRRLVKLKPLVF